MSVGDSLHTRRLWLLPLTRAILERRVTDDQFAMGLQTPAGRIQVHFHADWPGEDMLPLLPLLLEAMGPEPNAESGQFVLVERATGWALGVIGLKGVFDGTGEVEIGFAVVISERSMGFATEAARSLAEAILEKRPKITAVTAETTQKNRASQRVLEKAGFSQVGSRIDETTGKPILLWRLERA